MIKKTLLLFSFPITLAYSQVGIGTATPDTNSVLELASTDKALLLPRVTNTAAVSSPTDGMIVYDISENCLKAYENKAWSVCLSKEFGNAEFDIPYKKTIISVVGTPKLIDNATNQLIIDVPYVYGEGNYNAWSETATLPAGEGGDVNTITLSYPSGTFSTTGGTVPVTVTVTGADSSYQVEQYAAGTTNVLFSVPFKVNGFDKGLLELNVLGQ